VRILGLTAFGVATLAVANGIAIAKSTPPFDWKTLHRPLHVPTLAAGAPCPTPSSRPYPVASAMTLNGGGPAYLLGVANAPGGVIDITRSFPDSRGWMGQKTPWVVRSSYRGPVLIRGVRIDVPGELRFAIGYGQHLLELRWPRGVDVNQSRGGPYRGFAATTMFRSAGCYAFQADGTTFSKVVVMAVKA
jgi:hypothetical protein